MEKGYFFCGDILGFSDIVENLNDNALTQKIDSWVQLVKENANRCKIERYQMISDTVFAVSQEIEPLIAFAEQLLSEGIQQSLPIRGAISYGEYKWGKLVYGKAVVAAHRLETRQNWIGVSLDVNEPLPKSIEELQLVRYPIPTQKTDLIKLLPAIKWKVPTFEALASLLTKDGLGGIPGIGKELDWDLGNKIGNTVIFGLYLMELEQTKTSGEKFHGLHPVHFIDLRLRPR